MIQLLSKRFTQDAVFLALLTSLSMKLRNYSYFSTRYSYPFIFILSLRNFISAMGSWLYILILLSLYLTSVSMIVSSFFPVTGNGINSSSFLSEWYCVVRMYPVFRLHSSVLVHLGCFRVLVIVPSAALIAACRCLFKFWFPLGLRLGVGLLGHWGFLCFVF